MSFKPTSSFRLGFILVIALAAILALLSPARLSAEDGRRIKNRIAPVYPATARQAHITGTVKIEAVVSPSGEVRSTRIIGGHPMLAAAAQEAMRKWKYEPAAETSTLVVQFDFTAGM